MIIDLGQYKSSKSSLFTGRPQGESVRKKLNLDELDKELDPISVRIPSGTSSINPSFFLGVFFKSIKNLGFEKFLNKYTFEFEDDNPEIKSILKGHIEDALRNARNTISKKNSFSMFLKKNKK